MRKKDLRIGLALSGGGMRAAVFHLGVLKFLAEKGLLENVRYISTVSGASMCIGLMYMINNKRWVRSNEYLDRVLLEVEKVIVNEDIQLGIVKRTLVDIIHIFDSKSKKFIKSMKKNWKMQGYLGELEKTPKWYINAVSFETGQRFTFSQDWCGDNLGKIRGEKVEIAQAIAASAGFPILIGMYELKRERYEWYEENERRKIEQPKGKIHLWDGGIYDNMGLEPIYLLLEEEREIKRINFSIVSDAGSIDEEFVRYTRTRAIKRLLDISMKQIDNLNARCYMDHIVKDGRGVYVRIGRTAKEILEEREMIEIKKQRIIERSLSKDECKKVATYETNLKKVSKEDFDLILRHGYESMKISWKEG